MGARAEVAAAVASLARRARLARAGLFVSSLLLAVAPAVRPGIAGAAFPLDPLGGSQLRPQLAAQADGTLWAAAEDADGPGLLGFRSLDDGRTWTRAFAVADSVELSRPTLVVAEGETRRLLLVCERDAGGAHPSLAFFRLDLDTGVAGRGQVIAAAAGGDVRRPRLCVDAPEYHHWYAYLVYLARDAAGEARVELSRSLDFGTSWSAGEALPAAAGAEDPDVDFGQETLWVVAEAGALPRDVQALSSLDYGVTWSGPELLAASATDESEPRVAAANGGAAVAVAYTRQRAAGGTMVEAAVSGDGGRTWSTVLLSGLSSAARRPAVGASRTAGLLQAAWLDGPAVSHAYAPVERPARWSAPYAIGQAGAMTPEAAPSVAANSRRTAEASVVWAEAGLAGAGSRAVFAFGSWPAALVRADGGGDYPTIQEALLGAAPGAEVLLAPGVYRGEGNVDVDFGGRLAVVRGREPEAAACVIDCGGTAVAPHRAFRFHDGEGPEATLRNLTITGGHAAAGGPGGGRGGGVLIEGASPTLEGVVLLRNVAEEAGGGLYCAAGAAAGAIPLPGPTLSLCRIEQNVAGGGGGGLHAEGGLSLAVGYSVFYANRSEAGAGGLEVRAGTAAVVGCTFVLDGGGAGAAIALAEGATTTVTHTILAFGRRGPAVGCDGTSGADLTWCDVYDNAGGDWTGCLAGQFIPSRANLHADPLFCGLGTGVLSLRANSPCAAPAMGLYGIACPALPTAAPAPAPPLALSCAPNPFNPRTEIRFTLPAAGRARLAAYDLAGRRVAVLLDGSLPAGEHRLTWRGRDDGGRRLPSGAYLCRLEAVGGVRELRLLLLR